MLEQKTETIEFVESQISPDDELYLITWSPDPKEMPNSDFYLQHNVNVELLSGYLKQCKCGLFCVESTQLGNPHYHGWYQVNPATESFRIAYVKTMYRFGQLRIAKARSWKIFNWAESKNALYYYKKDLLDSMITIDPNPISRDTVSTVNFEVLDLIGFFDNRHKIECRIIDKISDRRFYREFYQDSIATVKN